MSPSRLPAMRRAAGLALVGVLLGLWAALWPFLARAQPPAPEVLVLNSYHYGEAWSDAELAGLLDTLQQKRPDLMTLVEYLDTKHFPQPEHAASMVRYLASKYWMHRFALVIALDNPALELLLQHRQQLFPGVPIVFAGVNDFRPELLAGQSGITGVAQREDVAGTLRLALALHPQARRVFVVHDYATSGLAMRREVEAALPLLPGQLQVDFAPDVPFDQLEQQLRSLSPEALVLQLSYVTDHNGRVFSRQESTRRISAASPVPVYALQDSQLGYGIVGGLLLPAREHGAQAAELALSILAGADPAGIPVATGRARPMFDYNQLRRFGIDEGRLPEGSLIINRPVSFFEQNKPLLLAVAGIVLGLGLIVLLLSLAILRARRAEAALRQSEQRWQFALEGAGDGVWDWDLATDQVYFSRRWKEIHGFAEHEIGSSMDEWRQRLHPDDREWVLAELGQHLAGNTPVYNSEYRMLGKDGSYKWMLDRGRVIARDADGKPLRMVGTHADVSERKRMEQALQANEARWRTLIQQLPAVVFAGPVELLQPMLFVSPQLEQLTGYTPEEWTDDPELWLRTTHPDDRERLLAAYEQLLKTGEPVHCEYRMLRRDGSVAWFEERASLVYDHEGKLQYIQGLAIDITERKRIEEERLEQARLNQELMDAMPCVAILVRRGSYQIVAANETARRYGMLPGEHCYATWFGRQTPCPWCLAPQLQATGQAQHGEVEVQGVIWDTHWIPVGPDLYLHYAFDITEHKRAEAERMEMERQLLHHQKLESLGVLAGGIAHDFNNLLTAITGNLELAQQDGTLGSTARLRIEHAVKAARRAADLTRQMLAYSGRGHFIIRELDLNALVEENSHLLQTAIAKTASLELRLAAQLPPIRADVAQVQQIVMNLITNASEALGGQPGVITLTTGVQDYDQAALSRSRLEVRPPAGRFVYLEVSDTGCGMDQETQERLFEPFFTTKFTGRGLGMAAVLGIVRGHQGAIFVDSAPGQGTTVRVLFPVAEVDAGQAAAAPAGGQPSAAGQVGPPALRGTVLVADDDEGVRELCRVALQDFGLNVLTAADGRQAADLFRERADQIDCVLLDLSMSGMDGLAALRELRRVAPAVKVILSSGYDESDALKQFAGEGLAGFLQKPYQLDSLYRKLAQVLAPAAPG